MKLEINVAYAQNIHFSLMYSEPYMAQERAVEDILGSIKEFF